MKKIVSLVLCLSLIFSAIQLPVMATNAEEPNVYYVSATGSDENDGLTLDTAFATIDKAQKLLENGGTIMVKGTVDFDGGEAHTGMITIKGVDAEAKLNLTGSKWYNQINDAVKLAGPTTFEEIIIPKKTNSKDVRLLTNGHELVLDRKSSGNSYVLAWVGNVDNSATSTKTEKITVNNWAGDEWNGLDLRMGAFGDATGRASGGVDVVINGGQLKRLELTKATVFEGNVNLTWNGGSFTTASGSAYDSAIGSNAVFNGAFQFISNNGLGNKILGSAFGNIDAADGEWFLYGDTTGGTLATTETAGKFEVVGNFEAVATNRDTRAEYVSQNGVLEVPAGTYDVTYRVGTNDKATIYVSENGNDKNDGLTANTALKTIDAAQKWLEKSTAQNKTIIVSGTVDFDGGEPHTDMITIKGADSNAKLNLVSSRWYNQINDAVALAGPTTFEEIIIPKKSDNKDVRLLTNGHEVVLDRKSSGNSYVLVWVGNVDNSATSTKTEKITVNNWAGDEWNGLDLRMGAFGDASGRASGGVDVVINGGHFKRLELTKGTVFEGNVNLTWNGGSFTTASGSAYDSAIGNNAVFNGAFQFISNSGLGNKILGSAFGNIDAADGEWFLYGDTTGGTLATTENTGKFEVIGDFEAVATNRDTHAEYVSQNGVLEVPAGTYDVTYRVATNDKATIYVSEDGNDQNDGLTEDTALKTIDAAQKWFEKSTAQNKTIIVSGTVDFDGGEPHTDMITIKGADADAKLNLVNSKWYSQINDVVVLQGPTTFEEIIIPKKSDNKDVRIVTNGHEVVLDRKNSDNGYVLLWVGNVDNSASCTKTEKITVNNWAGDQWNGLDIRVGAFGDTTGRTMGNVDVVINGGHLKRISFEKGTTINGDVNLTWNGGKFTTASGSAYDTAIGNNVVFNGAFQVISNNGLGEKIVGSALGSVDAAEGEWFLYGDNTGGKLAMTEVPGTYSLSGSTYAKAVNRADNSEYVAQNGVLTVPAGVYDVTFNESTTPGGPTDPDEPNEPGPTTPSLPEGKKMLYLDVTSKGQNEVFGQNVSLEQGKTYAVSFQYEFLQGDMNSSARFVLKDKFGSGKYVAHRSSHLEGEKGFVVTKDQATGTVTYTFTHTQESGDYGIGFQFFKSAKFYIANVTMYDTADAAKTNILPSAENADVNLKGWRSDWVSAGEVVEFDRKNNSDEMLYTASLQVYDSSLFGPTLPLGEKMLYVDAAANAKNEFLGQNVELVQGKTYTISYQFKFEKGDMNVSTYLQLKAELGSGKYTTYRSSHFDGNKGFTKSEEESTCTVFYTFTHEQATGTYGVGFQFTKATQMYLANVTMYEANDANKTNILPSATDEDFWLKGWRSDWKMAEEAEEFVLTGNNEVKYTVTLKSYDASKFVPREIAPTMIYIETSKKPESTTFGQNVKLEKGKNYTISFRYKIEEGGLNSSVYLRVKAALRSGKYTTYYNAKDMELSYNKETCAAIYTFTHEQESGTYCIGFDFNALTKMYLADFKVYETADRKQKNLLPSKGYEDSLFGWSTDWTEAKAEKAFELKNKKDEVIFKALALALDNNIFKPDPESESELKKPTLPEGEKMIYLDVTSKGQNEVFGQNVSLEQGKTYAVSFQYEFLQGDMNSSARFVLKDKFGSGKYVAHRSSHLEGEKGFVVTKDQATGTVTYTFTHTQESGDYGIGFQFFKSAKFYIANVTMYDTADAAKTNILPSAENADVNLKGWRSDWVSAGEVVEFERKNNSDEMLYTASLQVYDSSLFGPTLPLGEKMLYIDADANAKNEFLGQNVELVQGKTYTISYQFKFEKGDMNVSTYLQLKAELGSGKYTTYRSSHFDGNKGFTKTEEESTCTVFYTFTHEQATGTYGVGFQFTKATQMYLANVTMYEANDANKTNILPSASDEDFWLKGWRSDWKKAEEAEEFVLTGNNEVKYTVTLKSYDASKFVPREIAPTMIYIETSKKPEATTFGQNVKLEKGKNYTISFRYKIKEGDLNSSVYLRVKAALRSGKYTTYYDSNETGSKEMKLTYNKQTCAATYTFTHEQESGTYCIGFHFDALTKMYLADFKVYETADSKQKNLLPSKGYEDSLFGWSSDWKEAKAEKSFELKNKKDEVIFKALALALDDNIFKPDPELPPKMVYIENNGTYRSLLQRVKLVPGETYRFSFVVATPIALGGMVLHKGERVSIFNNMKPINDPDYTQDYYEMIFEFTLPKTHKGEAIDTTNIFVGIQMPPNSMAYFYKPTLWNVKDPEKTNLYKNPGFNKGLDNWIFSWGAWFVASQDGVGLNEFEDEEFKIQVMDYDTQKFITYYDDSRFDDGEWWSAESVAKEEKAGSAKIKGRFLTQNDKPIAKMKLVLKSLKETYEFETKKDGTFEFDKLPAGFYQLYYVQTVDGEETLVETGFAQNIKDGYTVNVDVHADIADAGIPMEVWFISGGTLLIAAAGISFILINKRKKGLLQKAEK